MKMVHVTINTSDLEKSLKFYQEIIGLSIRTDLRKTAGRPIVFLADGAEDVCVELIENPKQPYHGDGLSIGFHVDDVDAAYARLQEKGLMLSPVISPNLHTKFFFVDSPEGVRIQLI